MTTFYTLQDPTRQYSIAASVRMYKHRSYMCYVHYFDEMWPEDIAQAKVNDLDVLVIVKQEILRPHARMRLSVHRKPLEVPVHNVHRMHLHIGNT